MEQRTVYITLEGGKPTKRERKRRQSWERTVEWALAAAILLAGAAFIFSGWCLHKASSEREITLPIHSYQPAAVTEPEEAACVANMLLSLSRVPEVAWEPPAAPEPTSRYPAITEEERELLAKMVYLEARGESAEGQQAVVEVTMNRVVAENFPNTVREVLYQKGQYATAPHLETAEPTEAQYRAVDAAMEGTPILPLDVVYFSTKGENDNVWGAIGGHIFCYQYGA